MSPRDSSASVKMVSRAPNHAPAKNVMMVSIIPHILQYLLNVKVPSCLLKVFDKNIVINASVIVYSVTLFFSVTWLKDSGNDEAVT